MAMVTFERVPVVIYQFMHSEWKLLCKKLKISRKTKLKKSQLLNAVKIPIKYCNITEGCV